MKIDTKYHGNIDVQKDEIIHFEKGIPGFGDETEFVLLPFSDDELFMILQSVKTAQLGFVLTSPFTFFKDYDFTLGQATIDQLQIMIEQDVSVYVMLTILDPFENSTANLQAPIILNQKKNLAKQVILTNTSYQTKHKLFQENVETVK